MRHVKRFEINGIKTRQTACIELNGKPNAATKGQVGSLAIDVTSPLREVYKCVAVNGNTYTWELLTSVAGADCAERVKTINNKLIKFFFGTMAEYEALSEEDKKDVFAITTDGTTESDILKAIVNLSGALSTHTNHIYPLVATSLLNINNYACEISPLPAGVYLVEIAHVYSGVNAIHTGVGYIGDDGDGALYIINIAGCRVEIQNGSTLSEIAVLSNDVFDLNAGPTTISFYKMGGI